MSCLRPLLFYVSLPWHFILSWTG